MVKFTYVQVHKHIFFIEILDDKNYHLANGLTEVVDDVLNARPVLSTRRVLR